MYVLGNKKLMVHLTNTISQASEATGFQSPLGIDQNKQSSSPHGLRLQYQSVSYPMLPYRGKF